MQTLPSGEVIAQTIHTQYHEILEHLPDDDPLKQRAIDDEQADLLINVLEILAGGLLKIGWVSEGRAYGLCPDGQGAIVGVTNPDGTEAVAQYTHQRLIGTWLGRHDTPNGDPS